MDVLVAGQGRELLDPRLDVVPGDPLPGRDAGQVDVVDHLLVGLDHAVGHVDAEVALRLEHGDPEPALEDHLVLGRPDGDQVGAGVAGGQDVGDAHVERVYRRASRSVDAGRDVGAPLGAGERDRRDTLVRLRPGVGDRGADRGHGEHPAARGDQGAVAPRRTGVDGGDVVLRGEGLGADDHVAAAGRLRVAARGHHHGHRSARLPARRRDLVQHPVGRGLEERAERRVEQRHQGLGLRVAEARVELDHLHPARGQREAGVQQPGERRAAARHLVDGRLQHPGEHVLDETLRRPRERRVGAHAAGVRAPVAVEDALEVLGRLQRVDGVPVGDREQRHLRPVEVLLDDDALALTRVSRGRLRGRR